MAFVRASPFRRRQHLEAVHLRQFKIEQHHLGDWPGAVREEVHSFGAVTAHVYLIRQIALLECPQRELGIVRVVLDEQNVDSMWGHQRSSPGRVK